MASRSKPYEIVWPLNPEQIENLDQMLRELYQDVDTVTEVVDSGGGGGSSITLPLTVPDGGTGLTSISDEALLKGTGGGTLEAVPVGGEGDVLTVTGGTVGWAPSSGGGADPDLTYITAGDESVDLPNSLQLLAGDHIEFDTATPNELTIDAVDIIEAPATTVSGEIVLFDATDGLEVRSATGTGLVTATDGVYGVLDPSGFVIEGGTISPGAHPLLSAIHSDTIPATPVYGDMIIAGTPANPIATYVHAALVSTVVEDFEGIRAAYMLGFNGNELPPGIVGWGAPPPLPLVEPELPKQWLTWNFIDGFLQSDVMDDFVGIRSAMSAGNAGVGAGWAYTAYPVDIIPTPDPSNLGVGTDWQRLPIGDEEDVLIVKAGGPFWSDSVALGGTLNVVGITSLANLLAAQATVTGILNAQSGINVTGTVDVTGNIEVSGGIYEQGRTPALGDWVDIPYNAGDFSSSGGTGDSWDVEVGDLLVWQYRLIGNSVEYRLTIYTSSISGDPTTLHIAIPIPIAGFFAVGTIMQEGVVATYDNFIEVDGSGHPNELRIWKFPVGASDPFANTTGGTYVGFRIGGLILTP